MRLSRWAICGLALLATGCLDDEPRGLQWSPDGNTLAWVQRDHAVIHDLTQEEPALRSVESALEVAHDDLAWLPDSSAFVAVIPSGMTTDLRLIDINGHDQPLANTEESLLAPVIDPQSGAVFAAELTASGVDVAQWLDGERTAVIEEEGEQVPLGVSDSGRFLLHLGVSGGQTDLWVRDLTNGVSHRLTDSVAVETMARWLPRSTVVAFATQRGARSEVYVLDVTRPDPDRIWRGAGVVTDLEWRPDGEEIFVCVQGDLLRMSNRGRRVSRFPLAEIPVREVAVSPDGTRMALALPEEVALVDTGWIEMPHSAELDRVSQLRLGEAWIGGQDEDEIVPLHRIWLAEEQDPEMRAEIVGMMGEALSQSGEHERALEAFGLALSMTSPANPEWHRRMGRELFFFMGEQQRAKIAFNNYHSEMVLRDPDRQRTLIHDTLLSDETVTPLMIATASWQRAWSEQRWRAAARNYLSVLSLVPGRREEVIDYGIAMMDQMMDAMPGQSISIAHVGEGSLGYLRDAETRWTVERKMLRALLIDERLDQAASLLATVIQERQGREVIGEMIDLTRQALIRESLVGNALEGPFGNKPSEGIERVWRNPLVTQALGAHATVAQRLRLATLRIFAAHLRGDEETATREEAVAESLMNEPSLQPPHLAPMTRVVIASLRSGAQLRAGDNPSDSLDEAVKSIIEIAERWPQVFADEKLAGTAMAIIAQAHAAREHSMVTWRAMRDDGDFLALNLWIGALPLHLPQPGTQRMDWNAETTTCLESVDALIERQREIREDSPHWHVALLQARAMAMGGDALGAISLLREVEAQSNDESVKRAALWQRAMIHRAQGHELQVAETLDEWWDLHPTDAEERIALAWEEAVND